MPVRKGLMPHIVRLGGTTAGVASGFTYLGFPRGGVDAVQESLSEVCYVSNAAIAGTSIRMTQRNSAGTLVNDVTTPATTTVQGAAVDATLSTNTVNTGANFPWTLSPGDTVQLTAVTGTAQTVSVTCTIYTKGTV